MIARVVKFDRHRCVKRPLLQRRHPAPCRPGSNSNQTAATKISKTATVEDYTTVRKQSWRQNRGLQSGTGMLYWRKLYEGYACVWENINFQSPAISAHPDTIRPSPEAILYTTSVLHLHSASILSLRSFANIGIGEGIYNKHYDG